MLSIIIVTYNSHPLISACLDSLLNQPADLKLKIIVVGNHSVDQDQTEKIIQQYQNDDIVFIKNAENVGFAKAVNQALNYAQKNFSSPYFLLLNPDAKLKDNCLKYLIAAAQSDSPIGLVSPKIINPANGAIWFSQAYINWFKFKTLHASQSFFFKKMFPAYLPGCCLLIKKEVIEKIGLLDENIFLYYEDADYCLRAQQAGFKIKCEPKAICYHQESQSSDNQTKNYHLVKSGLYFFHQHYPRLLLPYFWLAYYLRKYYHQYVSKKEKVAKALKEFKPS